MKHQFLLFLLLAISALADTSATFAPGSPVTFSLAIASGSPPNAWQWRKDSLDGKGSQQITGANGATYHIAAITAADAGVYTCTVANSAGSANSDKGTLIISALPSVTAPGGVTIVITKL